MSVWGRENVCVEGGARGGGIGEDVKGNAQAREKCTHKTARTLGSCGATEEGKEVGDEEEAEEGEEAAGFLACHCHRHRDDDVD